MKHYIITEEEFELKLSKNYDVLNDSFRNRFHRGDRFPNTIADYKNRADAEAAYEETVKSNPPTMPKITGGRIGSLAYVTYWELVELEYSEGDDPLREFSEEIGLRGHDNFPTREQFDEYIADNTED